MEIFNMICNYFEIEQLDTITTFADFVPWFVKILAVLFILGTIFKALFNMIWQVNRGLSK